MPITSLPQAQILSVPAELASVDADLVVEAAKREAVLPWGEVALRTAGAFVVSSSSAFTDDTVLDRLKSDAARHGSQLIISPGAVAGIEAIAAAARLGLDLLVHTIVKPPASWRGTPAETLVSLDTLREPVTFFTGSARDAAARFPANANVTVVTALSGARGLDATRVELVADPGSAANRHIIRAAGAFGRLSVEIENRPLAANPRSSELAALALVRLIEDAASGMRI
jgi:aspartate dehydrogenase